MLANLDVVIGTVVILLGVSLIVTVVNQALSSVLALRERNLRWGLTVLIQELHAARFANPDAMRLFSKDLNADAFRAVTTVLQHPLVSDSKFPVVWWRLASTIRFDEFVKMLLLLGEQPRPDAQAQESLTWLRENHRITEPWFASMMDRVSQRFATHMRIYSVLVSAVLVALLGMDTLYIVNALRGDAALRAGLVTAASSAAAAPQLDPQAQQQFASLAQSVRANLPSDMSITALVYRPVTLESLPGMLASVVLLSLGAPFWFSMLKNLLALRSVVARKEESEQQRATPDVGDQIRVRSF
jgi:hypothetical protein